MSREIIEAMRALGAEKGISPEQLIAALEDALLSAYKKQPARPSTPASSSTPRPASTASSS